MRGLAWGALAALALSAAPAFAQSVSMPEVVEHAEPVYPEAARKQGHEAVVILAVTVDVDGTVAAVEVIEGAGEGFDEAAVEAGKRLRFTPARRADGTAVRAKIRYRYRFELTEAVVVVPEPEPPPPAPTPPPEPEPELEAIEVEVLGDKPPRELVKRQLERREIDRIPGTRGDALRSVQSLPGVARTAFNGALLVRGSAAFDSQTFVDGIYVPLIYHFGGLASVIPTELLEKIDFYPGNYSARYGRALGGIVDAGIRSPQADGYHGLAQLDLIDARLMLEGPIPWLDGWTFAAAGRRSHLDAWLGPVLEDAGAGVTQAPRYYDYQLMAERRWSPREHFRLSFYGGDDELELLLTEPSAGEPALSGNLGFSTAFQRLQAGFEVATGEGDVETQVALGHEVISVGFGSLFLDLEAFSLFGRTEYQRRLARSATLNAGVDMVVSQVGVNQRLPAPTAPGSPSNPPISTKNFISAQQTVTVFQPAVYVEAELTPTARWRVVPGIRLDYAKDTDRLDPNPRLSSRYELIEHSTALKGGVGVFTQPPQPQQSNPPFGTAGLRAERAIHYGLGVEQPVTDRFTASLDGFYKQVDDAITARPADSGVSAVWTNEGRRRSFGAELLLKVSPAEHFFGWLSYTLSRSTRQNAPDAAEVHVPWDQTHNLVALGSYRFGDGWELGARFRLVSGNFVDPNACNVQAEECDPTRVGALFHAASGAFTPIRIGGDNSERLPMFHALDVRIDKAWQIGVLKLSAYLDVQNVYNQQNAEGISYNYRYSLRQYVSGIPILPSIGLRAEFNTSDEAATMRSR